MKSILTLLMFCCLVDAFAFELKVSRMTKSPGFTARFELKTNAQEKVVLDCQSFIQGLLFGETGETGIMLDEYECRELQDGMKKSLRNFKPYCVELSDETGELFSHQTCTN